MLVLVVVVVLVLRTRGSERKLLHLERWKEKVLLTHLPTLSHHTRVPAGHPRHVRCVQATTCSIILLAHFSLLTERASEPIELSRGPP